MRYFWKTVNNKIHAKSQNMAVYWFKNGKMCWITKHAKLGFKQVKPGDIKIILLTKFTF